MQPFTETEGFWFSAMGNADPDPDPTTSFTPVENSEFFLYSTFIHISYSLLYIVLSSLVASKVSYCLVFFRQFWQWELEPIEEENRQQTKQPTKKSGGRGMKKSRTGTE